VQEQHEEREADEPQVPSPEGTGARTCSREESRLRRVSRRAQQLGYEMDDAADDKGVVRALGFEEESTVREPGPPPPPLLMLEAAAETVEAVTTEQLSTVSIARARVVSPTH
jgi:hypothetical protein